MSLAVAAAQMTAPATAMTTPAETSPTTTPAATLPTTNPATQPNGNGGVTVLPGGGLILNFKDATIDSVLDALSANAGFVVVKVVKPEGRVTLVSKQPVNGDDAISLLNTVLKNAGYAGIQQGRILKIVRREDAKKLNIPVRRGSDPTEVEPTDELITQVIPLRNVEAAQLRQDLSLVFSPEADVAANAASNSLIITDTAANIHKLLRIIAALDSQITDAVEVKVFPLQYATASAAAKLINDLFGTQASQSSQGSTSGSPFFRFGGDSGTPGGGSGGFPFGPGGFGGGRDSGGSRGGGSSGQSTRRTPRVTAASDDRTNSLVVTGPAATLEVIAGVIKGIDTNPIGDETVIIYRLKNAQSLNVEAVVNNLFNGTNMTRGTSNTLSTGRLGGTSSSNSRSSTGSGGRSSGGIGSSSGFGSSSAMGSRFGSSTGGVSSGFGGGGFGSLSSSSMRTASDLSGQVTIIADPDTNSLLVRTRPKNYERVKTVLDELDRPVAQVLIKVLIAEVTHDKSSDIGAEFSVLNLRPSGLGQKGGTNFGLANQTSGLVVQLLEENLTATLRALETSGKLDVLSRPYILASDNQQASITVGQEIPFITSSQTTDSGQTISQYQYGDVGILLDVIPHINPEGLVILDVAPEISALTATSVTIAPGVAIPVIAKRSAESRVAIRDGQTVVIGGLMEDRKTETIDKVPVLGDIPLLGELFTRKQNKKSKTELLIFLTPHVASIPENVPALSRGEVQSSKLVPNSVVPGAFQEHMDAMNRGAATQPADAPVQPAEAPATRP